jgi:hypothetical protein
MQANCLAQIIRNNMFQHIFAARDDLIVVVPVVQDHIYDGHGTMSALVLYRILSYGASLPNYPYNGKS